jgi:hypothetical protein
MELVEQALYLVVRFEELAARYVALAFRVRQTSTRYREVLFKYRIACAERLGAHDRLRTAVRDYAVLRRRAGADCHDTVLELTHAANRATASELALAERRQLTAEIARWTVRVYAA